MVTLPIVRTWRKRHQDQAAQTSKNRVALEFPRKASINLNFLKKIIVLFIASTNRACLALPFTAAMALSAQHSTGAAWGLSPGLTAVVLLIQSFNFSVSGAT
jgi:hypothetical protein